MMKGFLPQMTLVTANVAAGAAAQTESPRQALNSPARPAFKFSVKSRLGALITGLLILATAGGLTGFILTSGQNQSAATNVRAYPVNVATAGISQVPIEIRGIGNVTPYSV